MFNSNGDAQLLTLLQFFFPSPHSLFLLSLPSQKFIILSWNDKTATNIEVSGLHVCFETYSRKRFHLFRQESTICFCWILYRCIFIWVFWRKGADTVFLDEILMYQWLEMVSMKVVIKWIFWDALLEKNSKGSRNKYLCTSVNVPPPCAFVWQWVS